MKIKQKLTELKLTVSNRGLKGENGLNQFRFIELIKGRHHQIAEFHSYESELFFY